MSLIGIADTKVFEGGNLTPEIPPKFWYRSKVLACPIRGFIKERAGAFSAVTGGRVLSFQHLSMGEAAALSLSMGMRRGQNSPVDKWSEKTSPGASERKKRRLPFPGSPVQTLLNVTKQLFYIVPNLWSNIWS